MLNTQSVHRRFRDNDQCLQYLFDLHFSDVQCRRCKRWNAYHRHPTKLCYTCNCGRSHVYPKKGTIFEASPISLTKWFYAIFLMYRAGPEGVSAKELERRLKVTYPTAWRMAKRIRGIMPQGGQRERGFSFEAFLLKCVKRK